MKEAIPITDAAASHGFSGRTRSRLKRALLVVCVGTLAASLLLGARFSWEICANDRAKQAELLQLTQQAAAQINRLLQPVSVAARPRRRGWRPKCARW